MEITNPVIDNYLEDIHRDTDPILAEMESRAADEDFPIVGPIVGRLLALLTEMSRARRIFEFGSGFGYSAFWLARAAGRNAHVVHVDKSQARSDQARDYMTRAKLHDRILFEVGDAFDVFNYHDEQWDLILFDHDKERYAEALKLAWPKLKPGGLLIADNVLWKGKILTGEKTPATQGIRDFTDAVLALPDSDTSILPVRDGVSVTWKRREL